ncbi:MAG: competence/damage-inducible protein A [Saprospiraceae bacterium]|nr:competence/damage-inducible protein A [Saprospiraceae bacterium]MBP7680108.1 competence/damage-inducible protein A [Saprospiraceae bacterium]
MNCIIITVGDEILIGQIVDTNSAWMAQQLNLQGLRVSEIISVSDTHQAIMSALAAAQKNADIVLMTGGLGPTKDDITKKAIADYFGVGMYFHEPTWEWIQSIFQRLKRPAKDIQKVQCLIPDNATPLHNKMGTAPGMWFESDNTVLVAMPGVPHEMRYLMEYEVLPRLRKQFSGVPVVHRNIMTAGAGETDIAERIRTVEDALHESVKLAYLPALGEVRLRFTGVHEDATWLNNYLNEQVQQVKKLIPELVYGYDNDTLETVVAALLMQQHKKLASAESCTGGYLSHRIVAHAGASTYFLGGVVCYVDELKMKLLGVKESTLATFGAVSEQVVTEMVNGALQHLKADVAVAISGIAGPNGGTPDKPVGTIWIAVGDVNTIKTLLLKGRTERQQNIHYATTVALNMLRIFLMR